MTMNYFKTSLILSAAVLSMGCQQRGPYDVGLLVKATSTVESVTKSYREVPGSGVKESIGVIGSGELCSDAMFSRGKSMETWAGEEQVNMEVVGETLVPRLVPDDQHEQEEVWVSLVMESTRAGGVGAVPDAAVEDGDRAGRPLEVGLIGVVGHTVLNIIVDLA